MPVAKAGATTAVSVAVSPYITVPGATVSAVVDEATAPTLWPRDPLLPVKLPESGV